MGMDIRKRLREMLNEVSKPKIAAGVLIKCITTNRVLLLQRNENGGKYHGVWSVMSGGIEEGEDILNGLKREVKEELSINPNIIKYDFVNIEESPNNTMKFHYYEGFTNKEFIPTLCDENLDYGWFSQDDLPSPLYPRLDGKIDDIWET